jgi:glycosyltransferase involved in cell wall biosynthesis
MAVNRPPTHTGRPLRLLWLIDSLNMGGAERLAATFARTIDPSEVELQVCCLRSIGGNPLAPEIDAAGVPVVDLGARHLRDISAFRRLARLLVAERFDLVHAHLTYASIWGALASRMTGIPLVASLHVQPSAASPWSRERIRERVMCSLLDRWGARTVAVSAAQGAAYVEMNRLRADKLEVIHNGIEVDVYAAQRGDERLEVRREFGIPPEAPIAITVSVLREYRKGIHHLLDAAALAANAVQDLHFLIVGDGPLRGGLEHQARALGLSDRVRWVGQRADIPRLLAGSDLFVLPSLQDPFPTVIMEAMAAGLPAVGTIVDGIPEIIKAPSTGRLVPPGDPVALQDAIVELLGSGDLQTYREAARRRAREHFSAEVWADRLLNLYARVLGLHSTGPEA